MSTMPGARMETRVSYRVRSEGGETDHEQRDKFPDEPWGFVLYERTEIRRYDGRGRRWRDTDRTDRDLARLDPEQLAGLITSGTEALMDAAFTYNRNLNAAKLCPGSGGLVVDEPAGSRTACRECGRSVLVGALEDGTPVLGKHHVWREPEPEVAS